MREIAGVIGRRLGVPVVTKPAEGAGDPFGFLAPMIALDSPASCALTRDALGWRAVERGLLADLDSDHYFAAGGGPSREDALDRQPIERPACPGADVAGPIQRQPHGVRSARKEEEGHPHAFSLAGLRESLRVRRRDDLVVRGRPEEDGRVARPDLELAREATPQLEIEIAPAVIPLQSGGGNG